MQDWRNGNLRDFANYFAATSFVAKQCPKTIVQLQKADTYKDLNDQSIENFVKDVGDFLSPDAPKDISVRRFEYLCYNIELAYLTSNSTLLKTYMSSLLKYTNEIIQKVDTIKDVAAKRDLLEKLQDTDYLDNMKLADFEEIRKEIASLCIYIDKKVRQVISSDFTDKVLSVEYTENVTTSETVTANLEPYDRRVNNYIKTHMNDGVIQKIYLNKQLSDEDIKELEHIFWHDLGTKEEYKDIAQDKNLGVFIRNITGLDKIAANEAFATFLNNHNLNLEQSSFVKMIIGYIVENGVIESKQVLVSEQPFDSYSITEIFDDVSVVKDLFSTIDKVKTKVVLS